MLHYSKKQISFIEKKANELLPTVENWKQHCNRLHYGMKNGKQVQFWALGRIFTIEKCEATNIVFTWLFCGETANVCVNLNTGKICHDKGGMICH